MLAYIYNKSNNGIKNYKLLNLLVYISFSVIFLTKVITFPQFYLIFNITDIDFSFDIRTFDEFLLRNLCTHARKSLNL
jgi:hypothetical protein